ncbi:hypothetical protein [Halomonas ventosae]|uniref:Uncharacterized protein n=1 Tax=Halomonas ventosae TaxID=229007 RepID=A0A4R6H023_9GAMM|nr:hypothetical protein [Halomonas ventosae]TDO01107.1 hypothetical protein DFO68_1221 [Halomonas ventosae]
MYNNFNTLHLAIARCLVTAGIGMLASAPAFAGLPFANVEGASGKVDPTVKTEFA